ncbi:MAG: hypothetical protein U0667_08300 [Chloroflexota bacterium]
MGRPMATGFLAVATLLAGGSPALGATSPSPRPSAADPSSAPVQCADAIAEMQAALPAIAREVLPVRPADAWPSFDATVAAMLPDEVLGERITANFVRGADPTLAWSPSLDDDPVTVADELGVADDRQHGVASTEGAGTARVFDAPTYHLVLVGTRVDGVPGSDLLPVLVARRLERWPDATCSVQHIAGLPVLLAESGIDRFAFLGYRDAWLVVDTSDTNPEGTSGDQPGAWDPALFRSEVEGAAAGIAALPEAPEQPPLEAPDVGTRITPPAASTELAGIIDDAFGTQNAVFGDSPVYLGRGRLAVELFAGFLPSLRRAATSLGVDTRTLWGDLTFGFDIDDATAALEFVALIDSEGDGSRWVEPIFDGFRGPSFMSDGVDYGFDEGPSAPPAVVGEMTLGGKTVTGLEVEQYGDTTYTAAYATGPFLFLVSAGSKDTIEGIVEALP